MTAPARETVPLPPIDPGWRDTSLKGALDELGAEAVTRLALPPTWTEGLALHSGLFGDAEELSTFLTVCEQYNWCTRRPVRYHGGAAEAPAELLVTTTVALLRAGAPSGVAARAGHAAVDTLDRLPAAEQAEAGRRLAAELDLLAASSVAGFGRFARYSPAGAQPSSTVPDRETTGPALASMSATQLAAAATPLADTLPVEELSELVSRCVEEGEVRTAARLLSAAAHRLPTETVRAEVEALVARVPPDDPTEQAALGHLAAAAASGDSVDQALDLVQKVQSERLRARTLASLAGILVKRASARVDEVLQRLARTVVQGSDVDLAAAADAVQQLTDAGAPSSAEPLLTLAGRALENRTRRGSEVSALVRLASAAARSGTTEQARGFRAAALAAARAEGDPLVRAGALLQLLAGLPQEMRPQVAQEALEAARGVVDTDDRAVLLARLVPHLPGVVQAEALEELIGLCTPDESRYAFWMPDAARKEVLPLLSARAEPRPADVAGEVGRRLLELASVIPPGQPPDDRAVPVILPPTTRRWAVLAAELRPDDSTGTAVGDTLLAQVERLLKSAATAEALRWVESARQLLPVVHGTFETSVLLAERRIEVEQRQQYDRRQLERFLERTEQVQAFAALLKAPDDGTWALHYLGHGGVGKTMLLRFITADLAPRTGRLTARVDFDRLNPDFPLRRPGQLLLDLLTELEPYATGDLRHHYLDAREKLRHLEWWVDEGDSAQDLERATDRFCEYVSRLSRPVVLVLDTCEELTKFQPRGASVPQLDAAFSLLERIHRRVPSVRVLLAGRRPLAASGPGWRMDPADLAAVPAAKDYLAVHEILGFTEDEAARYLLAVEDLPLERDSEDLRRLLDRCVDPHETAFLNDSVTGTRYSPFDLALNASAARDDPRYADVAPNEDVYIETRVRRRLGERWSGLLATVTLLRRFDQEMLGAAVPTEDLDDAWRELKATEWTRSSFDGALERPFLEVDPGLQRRLEAYFRRPAHEAELERVRPAIGTALDQLVRNCDLDKLAIEAVEATLRTLDPVAAAGLVECLTITVVREGAWMWAHSVFGRMLGPEGVLADPAAPARPGALLLFLTAALQIGTTGVQRAEWQEVVRGAAAHPDAAYATWLRTVAALHADPADAAALAEGLSSVAQLLENEPGRATWLLGTCLSVLEMHGARGPDDELVDRLVETAEQLSRHGFHGVAALLLAEASSWVTVTDGRRSGLLQAALQAVAETPPGGEPSSCVSADWAAPARARERVRLRAVLAGLVEDREQWLTDALAAAPSTDPDADRLAAALLDDWLGDAPVPIGVLAAATDAVGEEPPPSGGARYAGVPPLRVALSRGWLAFGRASEALDVLGQRGRFAHTAADQLTLDLARVDVARRLRLEAQDRRLRTSLCASHPLSEVPRAAEATGLLDGRLPPLRRSAGPADVHVSWRVSAAAPHELMRAVANLAVSPGRDDDSVDPLRIALSLDAAEARLVAAGAVPVQPFAVDGVPWSSLAQDVGQEESCRLLMRALALDDVPLEAWGRWFESVTTGPRRVGPRRLAEWALEEGELLALRLARPGEVLLRQAADWFQNAGDPVGRLLASVTAALAAERSGRKPDVHALDTALAGARRVVPALPASLRDLSRTDLLSEEPGDWTGVLVRLAALERDRRLLRTETRTERGYSSPELAGRGSRTDSVREASGSTSAVESIRSRVGAKQEPAAPSSPVHGPLRPPGPPEGAGRQQASRAQATTWSRWGWRVFGGALTSVFAALVAAVVWLAYRGFSAAVSHPLGASPTWVRIPLFVVALVGLLAVAVRIGTNGPAVNELHVQVTGEGSDLHVRAAGFRKRRGLPARRADGVVDVRPDGRGSLWRSGPTKRPLGAQLRPLAHPRAALRVTVEAPLAAVGLPWEVFLRDELRDLGPIRVHRCFIRSHNVRASQTSAPLTGRLLYAAPPEWVSFFESVPREHVPEAGDRVLVQPMTADRSPGRGDLAVLVGVPVESSVGLRLVVPSTLLVEPDAVSPDGSLVVVAGLPLPDRPDSEADAADMHDLRRCAADLVVAGADYAVVLPSLPATDLRRCLVALSTSLRPPRLLSTRPVESAVDRVREELRLAGEAAEHEVTELHAQR
jgi:hypothetical protein